MWTHVLHMVCVIVLPNLHGDIAVEAWSPFCITACVFERTVPLLLIRITLTTVTETVTVPLALAAGVGVVETTVVAFSPLLAAICALKKPMATRARHRTSATANTFLSILVISILESFETIVAPFGPAPYGLRERCVVAVLRDSPIFPVRGSVSGSAG